MSRAPTPTRSPGACVRSLMARDGGLVAPGVYDGLTAKLTERAGFAGAFLTGAGVSYTSLGKGDRGFVGLGEMIDRARQVTGATSLPVLADADTGYGNAVNVYYTVQEFERAGVAGVMLEDQPMPKKCAYYDGMEVVPVETMVGKIRAACDARRDDDFVIITRTDARAAAGLDEAIRRTRAYEQAGADVVFVEALLSEEEMRAAVAAVSIPSMVAVVEGSPSPNLDVATLADIGFGLIVHPNSITRATAFAAHSVLEAIATEGSTDRELGRMFDYDTLSGILGVPEEREMELRYDGAAQRPAPR